VGWESYGFYRCSVLVITGVFKFLLPQKNAEDDDFRANLVTRLFDRMVRGIWLQVLPTDDDFNYVSSAMEQDWDDLLPLLVEHNLITKCKVTDDVESYEYAKASWECFQTMTHLMLKPLLYANQALH
jgi:hypothetical protein